MKLTVYQGTRCLLVFGTRLAAPVVPCLASKLAATNTAMFGHSVSLIEIYSLANFFDCCSIFCFYIPFANCKPFAAAVRLNIESEKNANHRQRLVEQKK